MSKRFRASMRALDGVHANVDRRLRGGVSANKDIRDAVRRGIRRKLTFIREAQQQEAGRGELPHELLDQKDGKVLKKHSMTDSEARERNNSIRSLGMAWRRCGY